MDEDDKYEAVYDYGGMAGWPAIVMFCVMMLVVVAAICIIFFI